MSTALLARSNLGRAASLKPSSFGDALPACSEAQDGWRVGAAVALRLFVDEALPDAEASNEEFGAARISRGGAFNSASVLSAIVLDPSSTTVETKVVASSSQLPCPGGGRGAVRGSRAMEEGAMLRPASSTQRRSCRLSKICGPKIA